jgi:DNA-binding protein HU-beta
MGALINKKAVLLTKAPVFKGFDLHSSFRPINLLNVFQIPVHYTLNLYIMNKAELIEAIANNSGLSKADSKKALDAFIETTTDTLKKGDRVALVGFGSWSVSSRAARTGRNPQTGKEIKISAKNVVKFKAGAELSDAVK